MRKKRNTQSEHTPGVPDAPSENGHYMGCNYGFDYEDGRYYIAPCVSQPLNELLDDEAGLRQMIEAHNAYLRQAFTALAKKKGEWWTNALREYGLRGTYQYFRNHGDRPYIEAVKPEPKAEERG